MDQTGLDALATALDAVAGGGAGGALGADSIAVGYGGSLTSDVALFADSLGEAARRGAGALSPVAEAMMEPLGAIDREAAALGEYAVEASASGQELTPGELVELTMRSQEFMFHSQLTANVANRTADGLQQLLRQQG